jgi:hypothetical protein
MFEQVGYCADVLVDVRVCKLCPFSRSWVGFVLVVLLPVMLNAKGGVLFVGFQNVVDDHRFILFFIRGHYVRCSPVVWGADGAQLMFRGLAGVEGYNTISGSGFSVYVKLDIVIGSGNGEVKVKICGRYSPYIRYSTHRHT